MKIFRNKTFRKWMPNMKFQLSILTLTTCSTTQHHLQMTMVTFRMISVDNRVLVLQITMCLAQFARQFSTETAWHVTCFYTTEKDCTHVTCAICSLFREANWRCTNVNTSVQYSRLPVIHATSDLVIKSSWTHTNSLIVIVHRLIIVDSAVIARQRTKVNWRPSLIRMKPFVLVHSHSRVAYVTPNFLNFLIWKSTSVLVPRNYRMLVTFAVGNFCTWKIWRSMWIIRTVVSGHLPALSAVVGFLSLVIWRGT